MQEKVLCFGDCNVDILISINELPIKGGCTFSSQKVVNIGGSAANVCFGVNYFGVKTYLVSKLGKDIFGKIAKEHLMELGINTNNILKSENYDTGLVIGLVFPDGEKKWISVRKKVADIHVNWGEIEGIRLPEIIYISGIIINEGVETKLSAIKLAMKAKNERKKITFDPNIRIPKTKMKESIREDYLKILEYVDIFLPNSKELQMITKTDDIRKAALKILERGVSEIWIKDGRNGCFFCNRKEFTHFPAFNNKAQDSSGAGDMFDSALIFARVIKKHNVEISGKFAVNFASETTKYLGTTSVLDKINFSFALEDAE